MAPQAKSFVDVDTDLRKQPERVVVKPPAVKQNKGGKILTGLLKYKNNRDFEQDFSITGPPCEAYRLVDPTTGTVKYPKCTLLLVSELDAKNHAGLGAFGKERARFLDFVRFIEETATARVSSDSAAYFLKDFDPSKISLVSCIKTPPSEDKELRMTCKLAVSDEAGSNKEDMDPNHIRLQIIDGQTGQQIPITDMRRDDVYLPVFNSAYPYFTTRGDFGIQWKLDKLVVLVRGTPSAGEGGDSAGIASLVRRYMQPDTEEASAADDVVQETATETVTVKRELACNEEPDSNKKIKVTVA